MIFLRINCPNAAHHVASTVWALEVVIGVSRQIEYDWLSILRYDMIRCITFTCAQKLTNLLHGTKRRKSNEETKNKKPRCSEETISIIKSVVSPGAGRESMVGKVYERGRSWAGSEREGVMDAQSGELIDIVRTCSRSMNRQVRSSRWP